MKGLGEWRLETAGTCRGEWRAFSVGLYTCLVDYYFVKIFAVPPWGRSLFSCPNDIGLGHKTCANQQNMKGSDLYHFEAEAFETRQAHHVLFSLPQDGYISARGCSISLDAEFKTMGRASPSCSGPALCE